VPDAAYISYDRLPRDARDEAEEPRIAPDAAFEIMSSSDRIAHVEHKIDVYMRSGTLLVAVIDPAQRTIRLIDRDGERTLTVADAFRHVALPALAFDIAEFFSILDE
jgi:Uma2 family endonuclease